MMETILLILALGNLIFTLWLGWMFRKGLWCWMWHRKHRDCWLVCNGVTSRSCRKCSHVQKNIELRPRKHK